MTRKLPDINSLFLCFMPRAQTRSPFCLAVNFPRECTRANAIGLSHDKAGSHFGCETAVRREAPKEATQLKSCFFRDHMQSKCFSRQASGPKLRHNGPSRLGGAGFCGVGNGHTTAMALDAPRRSMPRTRRGVQQKLSMDSVPSTPPPLPPPSCCHEA